MKNHIIRLYHKTIGRFFVLHHLYLIDLRKSNKKKLKPPFELIKIERDDLNKYDLIVEERKTGYLKSIQEKVDNPRIYGLGVLDPIINQIVYSCWIKVDSYYHDALQKEITIADDECYFFDAHCIRTHRGLGLHGYMIQERINYAFDLGKKRAYIGIMGFNTPALRVAKTFNYRKIKSEFRYKQGSISKFLKALVSKLCLKGAKTF